MKYEETVSKLENQIAFINYLSRDEIHLWVNGERYYFYLQYYNWEDED